MEEPKRLLCWSVYVKRLLDQTEQEHHAHVTKVNTPLTTPFLQKYGILTYTVKHNDSYARQFQERIMGGMPEEQFLDFDCILEMVIPDVECIEKMQKDDDFIKECLPDHFKFADMSRCKGSLTWIEEIHF